MGLTCEIKAFFRALTGMTGVRFVPGTKDLDRIHGVRVNPDCWTRLASDAFVWS